MWRLELSISGELKNVALVDACIAAACRLVAPLSEGQLFEIQLAAAEWLKNVVKHSLGQQGDRRINSVLEIDEERLTMTFVDRGNGLQHQGDLKRLFLVPPDPLVECGRGMYLIASLMDEVANHRSDGQNILKMTKFFKKAS